MEFNFMGQIVSERAKWIPFYPWSWNFVSLAKAVPVSQVLGESEPSGENAHVPFSVLVSIKPFSSSQSGFHGAKLFSNYSLQEFSYLLCGENLFVSGCLCRGRSWGQIIACPAQTAVPKLGPGALYPVLSCGEAIMIPSGDGRIVCALGVSP